MPSPLHSQEEPPEPFRPVRATLFDRREQTLELVVFLFLIVPSMFFALAATRRGQLHFATVAWATIARDLALVSLVAFFAWRNGEPRARFGWTGRKWPREMLLGVLAYLPFTFIVGMFEQLVGLAGIPARATPLPSFLSARSLPQFLLAAVLVLVVAVTEEIIFRGYLIVRFRAVFRSPFSAAFAAAAIFALGHGYEGAAGEITVGFMGLLFGLVFLWRRSLVAPMTMHFLQDFLGIVLLPLLGRR